MTPLQVLIVAVRVFAIVLFLSSISHLLAILSYWHESEPNRRTAIALAWPLLEFVVFLLLWLFPATLSRNLLGGDARPVSSIQPRYREWKVTLVIVVGLLTLSFAIPDTDYWVLFFVAWTQQGPGGVLGADWWAQLAGAVAELLVGVCLVAGGRTTARLLFRLRSVEAKD